MFRANNFDKLLDKATTNLRLDPDWPTILQICDMIRQNDCTPKYAVAGIKKKLQSENPHQAMFALLTLESIVKNCGSGVHDEVTSKAFCEMLRELVKSSTAHENLRNKILELIQAWAFAFRNSPKYRAVQDTMNILKAEGNKFPALKESDAMFSADTAPEWAEGEVCHRCRVQFTLMVRKHHCRACGQVFCQLCSSKNSTLPKFGIEKEVRVCDACFDKVSKPPSSSAKLDIIDSSSDYGSTTPTPAPKRPGKSAEELQEEEELQLALALSQSEAEQKEKDRRSRSHISVNPTASHLAATLSPTPSSVSASPEHSSQAVNAELSRYLDRGYWEQRLSSRDAAAPTAPESVSSVATVDYASKPTQAQEDDAEDKEIDEFIGTLKSQIEIFVNRMKSNSSRGRSIANDTSVQTLFMNVTAMHSTLLKYIQQQDDKRVYLEGLQDKYNQIRDSRAALDTLRAEHAARVAAAAEAAERQRQMQMATKLEAMRKKKHEYLQYQRQLALQRVQEQEREMQMRQEQQKHQYMMSTAGGYYATPMHQYQAGFNPSVYANPHFHQMMPQSADGMPLPGQAPMANTATSLQQPMSINQPYVTNPAVSQAMPTQAMPQANVRQMPQQVHPMMMQQMRQMPPGQVLHQSVGQTSIANGVQQNGQQLGKNALASSMIPNMTMAQQGNPNNPMLAMQMRLMGNQGQQVTVSGYPSMPGQVGTIPGMPQQSALGQTMPSHLMVGQNQPFIQSGQVPQVSQAGVPVSQGAQIGYHQMQPTSQPLHGPQNQLPNNQNPNLAPAQQLPNQSQGQQMHQGQIPGHQFPNQVAHMHPQMPGQAMAQHQIQHGVLNQGQGMQSAPLGLSHQMGQGQMMPPNQQMLQGHQVSQGPQVPTGQQNIQGQQISQNSQAPQISQGQQMPPGQQMLQGQQMHPGQQIPLSQQIPQGQPMPPGQHIPQGSQVPLGQQMPQGQQMPPNQPIPQQVPPGQQMPQMTPGQHMPQGQQIAPGQLVLQVQSQQMQPNVGAAKMPQDMANIQGMQNLQINTQPQVKSESNNNTAELISFD